MAYKDGVSIIVTVFNKQDYIEKTLKSIFKQMNSLTQLIVVNDGSTDNSLKLIKKNLQNLKYENKLITQKNLGPSISINNALRFAKYSYIKLVDGDDIIAPDALSYMKKEMNRLDLDLLYGYWEWSDQLDRFKFKKKLYLANLIKNPLKKFLISGWGGSSNLMVKTQALIAVGGCDENVFVQDFSIPMRIAGFHLKKKNKKPFAIGQSNKTICVGPVTQESRIMNNKGQTLFDLSLATLNFIEEHPNLSKDIKDKCKKKIIARCWSWQRKVNRESLCSKSFLFYVKSKIYNNFSSEKIRYFVFQTWKKQSYIRKLDFVCKDKKKILIYVGLDLLGDALIKLPMLRTLKKIFPNSHVTWIAGKGNSVFNGSLKKFSHNLIDKIVENANIGSRISELFFPIKTEDFDIVIDTQKRFLTTLILKKIKTQFFISPSCKFFFSSFTPSYSKEKNLSKQLLDLVFLFDSKNDYYFENSNYKSKNIRIAICPGASVKWKMWSIENFIELGDLLIKKNISPVFILGPKERKLRSKFKAKFKNSCVQNVVKSIDTIKLAKNCFAGISNDTGCGHLLAASGIPVITIFGPTNHEKFSPIGNRKNTTISSKKIYNSNNINSIKVSDVLEQVNKTLNIKI